MLKIRSENFSDLEDITKLNDLAFEGPQEGKIITAVRKNCTDIFSFVAITDDKIVGHILFSPSILESATKNIPGMGLAPMAVLPEFQNKGIGSKLALYGINKIKNTGCSFIIVLGHENFYPRFGFEPASKYGIKCQWDGVPDQAFMILILNKKIKLVSGTAKYRKEFFLDL